jgi:hypothetical protein
MFVYVPCRVDRLVSEHLRIQGMLNFTHCSFGSQVQRTFVTLHRALLTTQNNFNLVKEWGKISGCLV